MPLGLVCNAILNQACEDFQLRLESSLAMYSSEEQAQILAYIRMRPLKYLLGGLHITWNSLLFLVHVLFIFPLIIGVLWQTSPNPGLSGLI